ncbi:MAG TPA: AAA family ATPase [Candidatus Paceibacterota bacterium]|nr:AAA family ATPase [Candidatus Paceibacterota bacterium]HMP18802.1 AAA family ATPase [Candidatus Paceibacterota bacterium]HMP85297.1 AAA family ATPase [Candidatus Paceibacterota bacterium]
MHLKELEISGFKSFAKKSNLKFTAPISAIVGPNGSGKSNIAEAFRFVLGEQSIKSMRGKRGEDLIFNGTQTIAKQHKAGVKVVFDNSSKKLPIDFDEVIIERVVNRDGTNQYLINNSEVRLKDIIELLASANIGSSGHHIISQGEADRILNSSPKERKSILEDALGLKIFQYKKIESQKKLEKTKQNIEQVQSLRREIAPHIKFLKKQIEKIEEGQKMRLELSQFYQQYLKIESEYLKKQKEKLVNDINLPQKKVQEIDSKIAELENSTKSSEQSTYLFEIKKLEEQIFNLTKQKEDFLREIGRLEGQISYLVKLQQKNQNQDSHITLDRNQYIEFKKKLFTFIEKAKTEKDLNLLSKIIKDIQDLVSEFFSGDDFKNDQNFEIKTELEKHQKRSSEIISQIEEIKILEKDISNKISEIRQKMDADKSVFLEAEKQIVVLMSEKNKLQNEISKYAIELDTFNRDEALFKQELVEAVTLAGREVLNYENLQIQDEFLNEKERQIQIDRRKKLERMKIKVEELGIGSGEDVLKEHKEVTERDEFLLKEISDLEKTSESLNTLILELSEKIENRFYEGVSKINLEFQNFFSLMFGGGSASINIIKTEIRKKKDFDLSFDIDEEIIENEEENLKSEEGIEIKVNLPRKKINSLMMLSGGERALTSIALLFAISQVNPPPFIILDETDAALDEANSRKYGDMIENLSKNSQLILITHNRETMSRAGILYGVTMTGGSSQILSVAFDEGTQWAK